LIELRARRKPHLFKGRGKAGFGFCGVSQYFFLDKCCHLLYISRMRKATKTTSIRLTPEAKHLLEALAKRLGVTQAAIIEMAIRKFAERENVE
jgi:hypothetical protein